MVAPPLTVFCGNSGSRRVGRRLRQHSVQDIQLTPWLFRERLTEEHAAGSETISVTKNGIVTALNILDDFILVIAFVALRRAINLRYLDRPFEQEPVFAAASVTYRISQLFTPAESK
jgi:hypothetical protein